MSPLFSITNLTKWKNPTDLPFEKIKNEVLGKRYELSLVFIGLKRSKKLNFQYRGKNKSTDILSFSLSKKSGEIFITIEKVKKECKKFDRNLSNLVVFLFIHGLLHLKGMEHSSRMERAEEKIRRKFEI